MLSIIVAGAMIASTSTVLAATTKPTPKPSAKVTAKATKKPVARKPPTKKVVYKRKAVKVAPSPSSVWPPKKPFINPQGGEIYYKIPKANELAGALSAIAALAAQIKPCTKSACGVVTLGSTNGCTWWEVDSIVYGPLSATDSSPVPYGNLRTTVKATNKRQITTVLLVSTEALRNNVNVGGLQIYCHHDPVTTSPQKVPSNSYTLNTPTPAASPSDVAVTNTN